jgi:hypothetical protein
MLQPWINWLIQINFLTDAKFENFNLYKNHVTPFDNIFEIQQASMYYDIYELSLQLSDLM